MIEKSVHTMLASAPKVAAIVGTRIHQDRLPQRHSLPAIVIEADGESYDHHATGSLSLVTARFTVRALASQAWQAKTLRGHMRDALHAKRGVFGSHFVSAAFVNDTTPAQWDLREDGEETIDEQALDLEIHYRHH